MEFINVSQRVFHKGIIHSSSSSESDIFKAENILGEKGHWCTKKRSAAIKEYAVIDFEKQVPVDYIKITASSGGSSTFPNGFRLEVSNDGESWGIIYSESNTSLDENIHEVHFPLTLIRFLKILIIDPAVIGSNYYSEIGKVETGISGVQEIKSGSFLGLNTPEKLINGDPGSFWESAQNAVSVMESVNIDLGKICCVNRIVLGSMSEGFPESFHIETSVDNEIWITLLHENGIDAETGKKYFWETDIKPARFIRFEAPGRRLINGKFGVKISELSVSAAPVDYLHTHTIGDIAPHASVFHAGMVRLARDGEIVPGTAVQSTDSRLRDASNVFKGIVQLANDSDSTPGLAVQASDQRLQPASEQKAGIVRLAYNRETSANAVVQSSDSRLQHASEDNFGIVKICQDGEYTEQSVVSGNDSRLQKATSTSFGISRLAENGGTDAGTVVQANDSRLLDATYNNKGIVRVAKDGEVSDDAVVLSSDKRLKDATTRYKGLVELAEDGENEEGLAVQANDRRLKDATTESRGIVELAEDGENKIGAVVQSNDKRLKDATTERKGIVEFAEDGEDAANVAVQGSDRRLKKATEVSHGIVRFSSDGASESLTAVQANDKRLKDATIISKGIVELAEDGEDKDGVVVQGNDRRLKDATTSTKGIVELAEDGEDKDGVAVQGNDRRLKDATTSAKGIVELAENGEDAPGVAVQGNDRRLKDATSSFKGIVRLANDGENKEGTAVQGNDKRLKHATTVSKGIVEFAEDGEDAENVAVQGNDRRLKPATEKDSGIVRFAENGERRHHMAVQADDLRLNDKREPLPHVHDYAPAMHEYASHVGTISVKEKMSEPFSEITPPSDGSSVIYGNNLSDKNFSIGITGVSGAVSKEKINAYGVLGHSSHVGVRGQSSGSDGSGAGVEGASRFGAGGIFSSEHEYSLIADGSGSILNKFDPNIKLSGNGKALLVAGSSEFEGKIYVKGDGKEKNFPGGAAELFEVDETEYVSPGDLLIVSENGNSVLSKSKKSYSRSVIGIVSGNPYIVTNNSGKEEKLYPVVLSGKALCKVDARNNPVKPGDLIVTSDTAGCGMAGKIDSFEKTGTVIGKALHGLADGIELIPVFVIHS
ncbi:MAG: hypothetical protein CVV49_15005 [Spirochaetae bacterium HGW-Spirochaetae-5]|nr:MAG: hypothetical protein CVV49_15005 [Spirochaetae bacterium HGW-Spirochaetae-5]